MPFLIRAALLTCLAGSVVSAADPPVSEKVLKHLGKPAAETILRIETAQVFRAGKVTEVFQDAVGLRVVTDKGKPLTPEQVTRLTSVLLADETYFRNDSKGTTAAVAFRARAKDGANVEVSGCLAKGNVQIVVTDATGQVLKKGDVRGFRDDKASPFRALAAELFPDDPDVQKYKPTKRPPETSRSWATSDHPKPPAEQAKPATPLQAKSEPAIIPPPLPQGYFDTPPPGWLPINRLDDKTLWKDVQSVKDKVHLYLPNGDKPVRGVYLSVVFHSQDPRELARLWEYALVTVPWEMLYDVGLTDKRVKRGDQTKLPVGNMAWMLHYLEKSAAQTKHPELATAPIVGWLMQSGGDHAPDLYNRAPTRVVAWADSFPGPIRKHSALLEKCPYVIAWEFGPTDEKTRRAERELKSKDLVGKPTPAPNLLCEASTYDFPHGVYSKWNIFAVFLDRCIKARVPADLPEPGQPVNVRPIGRDAGWCADFNDVSEWVAIAPAKDAKGMVSPVWLPDEYAAWAYRAFHSHNPDLTLTAPVTEYLMPRAAPRGDRGVCGLGFGKVQGKAGEPVTLEAGPRGQVAKDKPLDRPWTYAKIEFRDGDKLLGTADKAPWQLAGVKFDAGLHALFVVGVRADGTRTCSRPALYGVR